MAVLGLRSVRGLSPVAASGGHSSSRCAGLSLSRPLLLRSTGSRRAGSVIVALGPSRSAACGIFPDQGSNPCPCIGRQILNHCATREGPPLLFVSWILFSTHTGRVLGSCEIIFGRHRSTLLPELWYRKWGFVKQTDGEVLPLCKEMTQLSDWFLGSKKGSVWVDFEVLHLGLDPDFATCGKKLGPVGSLCESWSLHLWHVLLDTSLGSSCFLTFRYVGPYFFK